MATHMTLVGYSPRFMKGGEQGGIDECTRPKHRRGPYKEFACHTCERETKDLRRKGEKDLISESEILVVKHLLSKNNIGGVCTSSCNVSNDGDHSLEAW